MKKKAVSAAILSIVFIFSLLIWPDFRYDVECGGGGNIGGCAPVENYIYSDFKLGGGWHWVNERVCFKDGNVLVQDDTCLSSGDEDVQRSPKYALAGSLAITIVAGLALFVPLRRQS